MSDKYKHCPECKCLVSVTEVDVAYEVVIRGFEIRKGPEHSNRCKFYSSESDHSRN